MGHRVVIVGGGVIGLCSAYSLARRGYDITIVDAEAPGSGASEGNPGWITPSLSGPVPAPGVVRESIKWMVKPDSPLYIKPTLDPRRISWLIKLWRNCNAPAFTSGLKATAALNERTFDLFDRLKLEGVEFEMHEAGLLFCFMDPSKRQHLLDDLELVASLGYSPILLEGSDIQSVEPAVTSEVRAGILLRQERQVRPETLVTGLTKSLLNEGADIRVASPVTGFVRSGGRVVGVEAGAETIEGDEFLIAAGAHSGDLARMLGRRVPVQAGKGYSLHYEPAPLEIGHALYLYEARVGATPLDGAVRFAGTMEFSGTNVRIRERRVQAIAAAAEHYLTDWPAEAQGRAWAGMRPMTPDGLPVIGRLTENVTIASGHAMLGVTLAPATGDVVSELIATGRAPEVIKPFDPGRF